jgi:hypothetical protein
MTPYSEAIKLPLETNIEWLFREQMTEKRFLWNIMKFQRKGSSAS